MTALVILMAALLTKHSTFQRLKRQVLLSEISFVKRKRSLCSIVNEGIRAILNLFIFFYKKISHAQEAQKAQKA